MVCLIHIERAGGTTLHYIFRNNFLSFVTLTPSLMSNDPSTVFSARELEALLRWLPFTKGFGGHTTRAYVGYEAVARKPIRYFTFLRDPVERYLSHFHFQVDRMGIPWSLEEFLNNSHFDNFMTTRIAGAPDLDLAKRLLRERFAFVGLTDRFDESLLLMRKLLDLDGFDIRYERRNAAQEVRSPANGEHVVDGAKLSEIRLRNQLDLELYDYARETLYPEYASRYGAGLSSDVERFQEENSGFRFSAHRRYGWALYRKLVYQPVELVGRRRYRRSPPLPVPSRGA